MRTMAVLVLYLASSLCFAGDRTEKVRVLMEAQGLVQVFQQQLDAGRVEQRREAKQVLDQMMAQLKPTKEFDARFRSAFEEYLKELQVPWTAQDIVDVWARYYGAAFTDHELDQLVAYYTSPLGKKDVMASQAAVPKFTRHFRELSQPLLERATKNFITRLQVIAKECGCKK